MRSLAAVLVELVEALPTEQHDAATRVSVVDAELEVPLEAQLDGRRGLRASLPRGRLATGFDSPLGRLSVSVVRGGE